MSKAYKVRYLTSGAATTRRVERVEENPSGDVWHVIETAAPNPHIEYRDITVRFTNDGPEVHGHRDDETPQYIAGILRRVKNAYDAKYHEPTD